MYIFLVVSLSSGRGFDHGPSYVTGSIAEGYLEVRVCGAVEG